jgi:AraC-like DNA-binding protein
MTDAGIEFRVAQPDEALSIFVERYWMLANRSDDEKEIVVIPDGRIDVFFSISAHEPFHVTLMGLETVPTQTMLPAQALTFAINFKLLAVEYLFGKSLPVLVNQAYNLPLDFLGIEKNDLDDFDSFCQKISKKIKLLLPEKVDTRKQQLFELIYSSDGSLSVKELSERVYWNSRQINRYFTQRFGLSLKAYCNILRFRASFQHIKEGRLFPEQNFTDQAHFIKEVKKLSGVTPKELFRNKNDRFLQFTALPKR